MMIFKTINASALVAGDFLLTLGVESAILKLRLI